MTLFLKKHLISKAIISFKTFFYFLIQSLIFLDIMMQSFFLFRVSFKFKSIMTRASNFRIRGINFEFGDSENNFFALIFFPQNSPNFRVFFGDSPNFSEIWSWNPRFTENFEFPRTRNPRLEALIWTRGPQVTKLL